MKNVVKNSTSLSDNLAEIYPIVCESGFAGGHHVLKKAKQRHANNRKTATGKCDQTVRNIVAIFEE